MTVVLTAGSFVIPHMGHSIFLEKSARLGDCLIVALGTDDYIERYKGKRPPFSYKEREAIIKLLPFVDEVYPNDSDDLKPMIDRVNPDIITIGSDWGDRYFDQIKVTPQWLVNHQILMTYIPYTREISSTTIKERCK